MRKQLLAGTALAALGVIAFQATAHAATIDDVMKRLDKLERENAELRAKVNGQQAYVKRDKDGKPVVESSVVTHARPAPSPVVAADRTVMGIPVKAAGALGPLIDNTTVQLYGHFDLSGDLFNPSVFDQGTKLGISSNLSYFGFRVRHNLAPYGFEGWAAVAQMEAQIDVAAAPTERAALGSRDSYVGLEGPWGAIKAGKSQTPYKLATASMDPFSGTLGDYNSIMGNTGGDNRAEFDWRMDHAVWYESPIWNGFQFSALFSPGQNYAQDNSDFSFGDEGQCNGASTRGSGSNFPVIALGAQGCNDGSFGNAYSAATIYRNSGFTAIAGYELHEQTNRQGDDGTGVAGGGPIVLPDGSVVSTGIHNEWAAKLGAGYRFNDGLGDLQLNAIYEWIRRDVTPAQEPFNERSKDDIFVSATQNIGKWAVSGSYTHATSTPGNPATLSVNTAALAPLATVQANLFGDAANQYAVGVRYHFSSWASWYFVASELTQGPGAHYCLGASGHGYQVCGRDAANDTIGGATLKAATTGLTLDF
jgi:predicted porin